MNLREAKNLGFDVVQQDDGWVVHCDADWSNRDRPVYENRHDALVAIGDYMAQSRRRQGDMGGISIDLP